MKKSRFLAGLLCLCMVFSLAACGGPVEGEPPVSDGPGTQEPGETPEQAARRELKEETGLDITGIRCVLPPAYSAVGLSNEQCVCVFGTAAGEIAPCKETGEEITARWYSKAELRDMLERGETFGSWAQAYSYMWAGYAC